MKKVTFLLLLLSITTFLFSQTIDKVINIKEVERIENTLASNEMLGRKVGTPGIEMAADFIAKEFKSIGLKPIGDLKDYKQRFTLLRPNQVSVSAKLGSEELDPKNVVVITSKSDLNINNTSGFERVVIGKGANFSVDVQKQLAANKNLLVLIDTSFSRNFSRINGLKRQIFKSDKSVIFVLTQTNPTEFTISAKHEFTEVPMANVVGVIPGKSLKNEFVVFSGHYDHLGVGKEVNGDSIYNGANDDAAGTTAVIALAKYYKALKKQ